MDNYYNRNKIIKSLDNIKPAHSNEKSFLSERSINQYQIILERLHLKYSGKVFNHDITNIFKNNDTTTLNLIIADMKYLNYKFIALLKSDYPSPSTFKTYITPIVKLLSYSDSPKYNKLYKYYASYMIKTNQEYEKKRDDNYISDEDKAKIITDFTTGTLLNNTDKLSNINDKVIYAIYSYIPPRRLEYAKMYVSNQSSKRNNSVNYIVLSRGNPKKFIFNQYKTAKTFGKQEYNIPPELALLLKKYIKINGLKNGDKFLNYDEKYLSEIITKVFYKVYDEKINLNFIRKAYATHINGLNISNNERKVLCESMGHSCEQSAKYKKII